MASSWKERSWRMRMRRASRSARPPVGVEDSAASGPFRRRARALMVKSRRRRSSPMVAGLTVGRAPGRA